MKSGNWKTWIGWPVYLMVMGLLVGSVVILQGPTGATDKMDGDGMLFVAHWTHTPENCTGRSKEGATMLNEFWAKRDLAAKKGVKILGADVAVTEHTYYIIAQAKDYQSMLEFFEPLAHKPVGFIRSRRWMNGRSTLIRRGRDESTASLGVGFTI